MKEQLKQIFDLRCDCYSTMVMQSAMTSDKFIEVVSELMKPTDNVNIEAIAEKEYPINEYSEKEHSTLTYKLYQSDQYSYRNAFIKGYKQAISKQHTHAWIEIKCEDDLPNDDGIYLIDCEHGVTMAEFSRYGNGNTSWWAVTAIGTYEDSEGAKKVTAWMPLPTHPQTTTTKTVKL